MVVGDHKALLTGWFVSPHTCVVYRTAVLLWTPLERINAEWNPHNLIHQSFWKKRKLYLLKSRQILLQSFQTSRLCAMQVRTCWFCGKFDTELDKVRPEVIRILELVVKATFCRHIIYGTRSLERHRCILAEARVHGAFLSPSE